MLEFENAGEKVGNGMQIKKFIRGIFLISRMRELTSQYLIKTETFLKKCTVHAHVHSHAHIYTYHFLTVGLPGKFGKLSGSVLLENKQKYFMVSLFLSCLTLL